VSLLKWNGFDAQHYYAIENNAERVVNCNHKLWLGGEG
jgi:hypothetical protein